VALKRAGKETEIIDVFHVLRMKKVSMNPESIGIVIKAASKCGDILMYEKTLKCAKEIMNEDLYVTCIESNSFIEEVAIVEDVVV
jgi:hypothetical protein